MSAVNKVILVGNLGQDPETRTAGSGSTVATLSVATNERRKDGDNWVDHTEWHRVVCFGTLAENVARFCRKGRQVYVEGKLRTRKWQDKDGNDKYTTEILADNVVFLGSGDGRDDRRDDRDDRRGGDDRRRDDDRRGGGGSGGRASGGW